MAKNESLEDRKKRAKNILRKLRKEYADADCALEHKSAFELLISTILSAQSTDKTVNTVTPVLFEQYPTADALAVSDQKEIEKLIKPTGFFRQKAKNIIGTSRELVDRFDGEVPDDMDKLLTLPGVARKTANVVLGTWFNKNAGVTVDTHVGRIAERLKLCWNHKNSKDARKIEQDLMEVIPRKEWTFFSHAIIWHGRRVCSARKPDCAGCSLRSECPSADLPN